MSTYQQVREIALAWISEQRQGALSSARNAVAKATGEDYWDEPLFSGTRRALEAEVKAGRLVKSSTRGSYGMRREPFYRTREREDEYLRELAESRAQHARDRERQPVLIDRLRALGIEPADTRYAGHLTLDLDGIEKLLEGINEQ